jgi:hypothetical protein
VPGGPQISFPRPDGWPDSINPNQANYHEYNKSVVTSANRECLQKYIQAHPTPGSPSPATPTGTPNDATPSLLSWGPSSPVKSYSIPLGATTIVVNVTEPAHPLFPGYVTRIVTQQGNNSVVNNMGEGAGGLQSNRNPLSGLINDIWYPLTDDAIKACTCSQ